MGIIDFDRMSLGDPWEEFNRITFCANISSHFATARINGYFNNWVPETFFNLMLYIGSNQLDSITWAMEFGENDVKFILEQATRVMDRYDGFERVVPKWYQVT